MLFGGYKIQDLSTGWLHCDPGPLFKQETHALPGWISDWVKAIIQLYNTKQFTRATVTTSKREAFTFQFPWKEITILPVQWHALCLGLFASIIAPFGGFFASGFKRAFKVKVCVR